MNHAVLVCVLASCSGGSGSPSDADIDARRFSGSNDSGIDAPPAGNGPQLAGCPVLPETHVFNTPIAALPVDPNSDAYISTIGGTTTLRLDLGTQTDQQAADFYGIPFNIVNGSTFTWPTIAYPSNSYSDESDCANAAQAVISPCDQEAVPKLPFPANMVVEGGVVTAPDGGDHHLLALDADACRLWEGFAVSRPGPGTWTMMCSATFDLRSNALRPASWTSADAAGFPIVPLLLKASEASSGEIKHALRYTILSNTIRTSYIWPATHQTNNGTASTSLPPMGQLLRLKASYVIPTSFTTQAKAILQALKTYGMYLADGGSDLYISGEPNAAWETATMIQIRTVVATDLEAVDITAITSRTGFDVNSGAVPPP